MAARVCARHAVVLALVFAALSPMSVLAFTPPAPGNPGNHFGELLHNPHMHSPAPGGGGGGGGRAGNGSSGITNALQIGTNVTSSAPSIAFPSLEFQPPTGGEFSSLTPAFNLGQDSVLVVLIVAALIAANVALGVLYLARGGNFLLRRALRPDPVAA